MSALFSAALKEIQKPSFFGELANGVKYDRNQWNRVQRDARRGELVAELITLGGSATFARLSEATGWSIASCRNLSGHCERAGLVRRILIDGKPAVEAIVKP